ncbi:hypothetical protein K1T71_008975 [Dendrolimus kikuchii]|uniref:Uncharacterized protein n=1 Tax=Dendrolimus kikuchii TaxID=765133 RepID=A0ACC1CVR4_9NEOP|nr:hypothetical protein K1T71_008975 [Dendrolimus kikuchii]
MEGRGLPRLLHPSTFALYICLVILSSCILSTCPNHRSIRFLTFTPTLSFRPTLFLTSVLRTRSASVFNGQSFDFIVVGGGSAGCVVANRLTENPDWSVLLIEAGDVPSIGSDTPGFYSFLDSSSEDWGDYSVKEGCTSQAVNNGSVHLTHGKGLGGSSSINYMFYVRGNQKDYNRWVEIGNEGWDWPTVLYYYKKSERLNSPEILKSNSGSLHNINGYLGVTKPSWEETRPYLQALKENGRRINIDTNDLHQIGYSVPTNTIDNGVRQSSAVAFIQSIHNRPNLHVLRKAYVRKLIIDKQRAIGVEVKLSDNSVINLFGRREIILSAGAINSPHILISSGIGPKEELEKLGINVVVNSPHVGKNMEDHAIITLAIKGKKDNTTLWENIQQYLGNLHRFPAPVLVGHIALDKNDTVPDYQAFLYPAPATSPIPLLLCTHVTKLDDKICSALSKAGINNELLLINLNLLKPKSKGFIKITSNDPEQRPSVYTRYLSDPDDLEKFTDNLLDFLTILNTDTFRNMNAEVADLDVEYCNHHKFGCREYWKCYIRNLVTTQYHFCCTCRMSPNGVVDPRLRVYGIKGLRVVDASICPEIVRANLNAPVIMIGEKAADMIKADHGMTVDN